MPIDFPCNNCQSKIRVPDGSGGKKTKCPKCATVQVIPTGTAPPSNPTPPVNPPSEKKEDDFWGDIKSESSGGSPDLFGGSGTSGGLGGGGSTESNPFSDPPSSTDAANPYASPAGGASNYQAKKTVTVESAKSSMMGPAICQIVTTVLSVLFHVLIFGVQIFAMQDQQFAQEFDSDAERIGFYIGFLGYPALITLFGIFIIFAMLQAMKLQSYGIVMAGFIIALIPCTTGCYCYIFHVGFSIWGIVVLADSGIRSVFRS